MILIIILVLVFPFTFEFSAFTVYGRLLKESFLDKYFTPERLAKYKENGCSGALIYGLSIPYISTIPVGILSKWQIRGIGRIPRWSKWHKRIYELHEEILFSTPKII